MFRHRFPPVTIEESGIFLVQQRRKIPKKSSQHLNSRRHISPPWMRVQISKLLQVPMLPCYSLFKQFEDPRLLFAELTNILGKIKPFRFCTVMPWSFRCLWLVLSVVSGHLLLSAGASAVGAVYLVALTRDLVQLTRISGWVLVFSVYSTAK